MKKILATILITGSLLVSGNAYAAQKRVAAPKPAPAQNSFEALYQETTPESAGVCTQADVSTFFANLRRELDKPENATHRYTVLVSSMERYRELVRNQPVDTHFKQVEYLLDVAKCNVLANVYGMVLQPFFTLEKLPLDSRDSVRITLEAGYYMSGVKGSFMMDNAAANSSAGIKALYLVRENPLTPESIKAIAANGIAKSYYSATWGQSLENVRQALKEALDLLKS